HFVVNAPSSATAGGAFLLTVTALDLFNNTVTGYSGTVHFTGTDGQALLPANSTLTNGVGNFLGTLKTAGTQTITASDTVSSSITGITGAISVSAATANHLAFSIPPSNTINGQFIAPVTVQILDAFNNPVSSHSTDQITLG